ncbi:MAG: hypothetical protein QNK83_03325 [Akkermansiaceae bacterium]
MANSSQTMTRRFKIILFCYISAVLSIPVTAFILYTKPRLDFSKKVDAGLGVKALEDACLLYYDKYGELPLSEELTQGATLSTKETEGGLIDILYNPDQPKNSPYEISFLDFKDARSGKSGISESEEGVDFLDPWGNPYFMPLVSNPGTDKIWLKFLIWSSGPDGESGTDDDITSRDT